MRIRRTALALATAALTLVLSGCISIKTETISQRAPGVFTVHATVCVTDNDQDTYPDCHVSNVAETDTFGDGDNNNAPESGQMLVGFRVPDGTTAPTSFQSAAHDTTFNESDSYAQQLSATFTPVAGEHWVGYVSGFKTIDPHNQAADRTTSFTPEFALPAQAGGGPFAGPLHWRMAIGFRALDNAGQSGDPVDCSGSNHVTICVDSPPNNPPDFPADLQTPVSDFGVLAGGGVSTGQGTTATVAFPVRFLDGGTLGARTLSLTASTAVPGSGATPSTTTLHIAPNTTQNVNVSVPVPAATPLGSYKVTLSAAEGSPAIVRSNSATVTVVDTQAPAIRISTPAQGSTFTRGAVVHADYGCTDQV